MIDGRQTQCAPTPGQPFEDARGGNSKRLVAHGIVLAIGSSTWGAAAALVLLAGSAVLVWTVARQRADGRASANRTDGLADDCERVSFEVMELVAAPGDAEQLRDRWLRLHARLVELEWLSTDAANAMADAAVQRSLDQLAASLIALRGALEADVRLRLESGSATVIVAAGDDAVVVRCEDVITNVRALGTRRT